MRLLCWDEILLLNVKWVPTAMAKVLSRFLCFMYNIRAGNMWCHDSTFPTYC